MTIYDNHHPNIECINRRDNEDFSSLIEKLDYEYQYFYFQQTGSFPPGFEDSFYSLSEITAGHLTSRGKPLWLNKKSSFLPEANVDLTTRLSNICDFFNLNELERDIILLSMFPRLNKIYSDIPMGGFQSGVTFGLLKSLRCSSQTDFKLLINSLSRTATLLKYNLLTTTDTNCNTHNTTEYVMSNTLWEYMCGHGSSLEYEYPFVRVIKDSFSGGSNSELYNKLYPLCLDNHKTRSPLIILHCNIMRGAEYMLSAALTKSGRKLVCLDIDGLSNLPSTQIESTFSEIISAAVMHNAAILFEKFNLSSRDERIIVKFIEKYTSDLKIPLFYICDSFSHVPVFNEKTCVHLQLNRSTAEEKMRALLAFWPEDATDEPDFVTSLAGLSDRYSFTIHDIPLLIQEACMYKEIKDPESKLSIDDFRKALLFKTRNDFGKLAKRISPTSTLNDIALSDELSLEIKEIIAAVKLKEHVINKFNKTNDAKNKGVSVLFYGGSGTGKTMAAEVIASSLGSDLIKIDLSTVVDKYIGETEKNLSKIFDLARTDNGVLFFDEADALFGKRSETKTSHDRHANIEVSYLLQRLEEHPGPVILATNHRSHLDSAFTRRFTFVTRFTTPKFEQRLKIWKNAWPNSFSISDDVNYEDLASREELTGANICNIAFLSAVLSASEGLNIIHLRHINSAIKRENAKSGRLML